MSATRTSMRSHRASKVGELTRVAQKRNVAVVELAVEPLEEEIASEQLAAQANELRSLRAEKHSRDNKALHERVVTQPCILQANRTVATT